VDKNTTSQAIFYKYLPPTAVTYCHQLWQEHRFKFIISPKRATKLGDYRFDSQSGHHTVTVNGNLNPLSFLTTYIHEVAHLTTFKRFGTKVLPHGKEWKNEFRLLFQPLLDENILPKDAVIKLKTFLKNPKASSCSEHGLFDAHSGEIALKENEALLKDIPGGTKFRLKNRQFVKLEHRRTRIMCLDSENGRKYLVHQSSIVSLVPRS
jgi:SprT protein